MLFTVPEVIYNSFYHVTHKKSNTGEEKHDNEQW